MGFTAAGLGALAKKIEASADGLSLHSADPGSTAANELTGDGYARRGAPYQQVGSTAILTSPQSFSVPAGTVAWVGLWQDKNSIDPATDFYGGFPLDTPQVFALPGIFTLDSGTYTFTNV